MKVNRIFLSVSDQPYHILIRSELKDDMLITEFLVTKENQSIWMYRLGLMNTVHQELVKDKLELIGLRFIQNMILTERFIRASGKIDSLNESIQDGDWYTLPEL